MEEPEVHLVGYWNGDIENPEIIFKTPQESDSKYKMVVISIRPAIVYRQEPNKYDIKKQVESLKNTSKELKNLIAATRRLK